MLRGTFIELSNPHSYLSEIPTLFQSKIPPPVVQIASLSRRLRARHRSVSVLSGRSGQAWHIGLVFEAEPTTAAVITRMPRIVHEPIPRLQTTKTMAFRSRLMD